MSERDNGGPAFPKPNKYPCEQDGMSLRDYFAAHALAGMAANESWVAYARGCIRGDGGSHHDARAWTATEAYGLADAMLAERAK